MAKTKTIRYSITVLGTIEVFGDESLSEQQIMDLIADDYFQCGGNIEYVNDVEYEVEEI
jgi:hypothetical protein